MKKFLVILSSFTLASSTIFNLSGCMNGQQNTREIEREIDRKKETDYDKTRIIKRLTSFSELSPLIVENNEYQTVKSDEAFDILKSKFKEFEEDLKLEQIAFSPIEVIKGSTVKYGELSISANYKDKELQNPKTNNADFVIPVATNNLKWSNDTIWKLNESITSSLSEMKIPVNGIWTSLGEILTGMLPIFVNFDNLPTKIPAAFNNTDKNWRQWEKFINNLKGLPVVGKMLENGKINYNLKKVWDVKQLFKNEKVENRVEFTIKGKYIDILNSLLPNIINFRNFVIEKSRKGKAQNLLLLLLKYLFEKPCNIDDDGFLEVNKNIKYQESVFFMFTDYTLKFKTNLEHILHNLLEGWKNKNDNWSNVKSPISIKIKAKWTPLSMATREDEITIKYKTIPTRGGFLSSGTEGIIDILPIESIKKFINQMFNYNLTTNLNLPISIRNIFTFDMSIPILEKIKNYLPSILKTSGHSSETIKNTDVELLGGVLQIEYQDKVNDEWKLADGVDDLKSAINMRVNIKNIKFKVTSTNDQTILLETTNKDLHLIFNPDIKPDILIKSSKL